MIDELLEAGDGVPVLSEPRSNPRNYGTAAIALMESLQLAKRLLPELPLDGLDEVSDEIRALVTPHSTDLTRLTSLDLCDPSAAAR